MVLVFKKINHNEAYILSQKSPKSVVVFYCLSIVLLTIFGYIYFNYNYDKCYDYIGIVKKDDNYNLYIYVKEAEVSYLHESKLLIDKKEYEFSINEISDEFYLINNSNYYLVKLNLNLDAKYLINNNILNIVIKSYQTTLYQEFRKGLKI